MARETAAGTKQDALGRGEMGLTRNAVPSSMMVGSWERQMSTARSQACLGREQTGTHEALLMGSPTGALTAEEPVSG